MSRWSSMHSAISIRAMRPPVFRVIDGAMQTGFTTKPVVAALDALAAAARVPPIGLVLGSGFEDKPRLDSGSGQALSAARQLRRDDRREQGPGDLLCHSRQTGHPASGDAARRHPIDRRMAGSRSASAAAAAATSASAAPPAQRDRGATSSSSSTASRLSIAGARVRRSRIVG